MKLPWCLTLIPFFVLAISLQTTHVRAVDLQDSLDPLTPEVADASGEAEDSMAAIRIPEGWEINLWAAEPDVANVVALDVDHQGRVYVCETFRQNRGVTDNRGHDQKWLLADLASKTVQDRIDYHKRLLGEAAVTYAQHDDRIRRLVDTDGDGKADQVVVVANGFNRIEEGTGAGIYVKDNDVYYTCIPKLWKLVDKDGDGKTDERVVLSDGYGVRVAFRGHDLHGVTRGYDGRLYFSIGDRGYHVRGDDSEVLADAVSGAVFRCELDGSGLEVFATGLRNPQELAFNDVGDWITVDNNSDSGDMARIVHLLQDSDTGWRMYYQYLPDRGPFNRERIWEPQNEEQPFVTLPPVANFTDGPSGLAYYPGTGFGDSLLDTFLICDFRGGPSNSGVRSFRLEPSGATYKLGANDQPIWTCLATDIAFGPDGALYVSDWVDGWDGLGKARVYQIKDENHSQSELVHEVNTLLSGDWSKRSVEELVDGLSHRDRRVRLESQWQLAERGEIDALKETLASNDASSVARRHAAWGLGHLARLQNAEENATPELVETALVSSLGVSDSALQCAAAEIIGEHQMASGRAALTQLLSVDDARVRYHAIDALGRLGRDDSNDDATIKTILGGCLEKDSNDPAIRHATIMYLSRIAQEPQLIGLANHENVQARLLAVAALRRQGSPSVATFLADSDERVVLEAARAIHDQPFTYAFDQLASLIDQPLQSEPLVQRVLNANFRLGTKDSAIALAKFATGTEGSEAMRIEALSMLSDWAEPSVLDRVLGDYRPVDQDRVLDAAAAALEPQIDLLMTAPEPIRLKAIEVASLLGIKKIAGELNKQIADTGRNAEARAKALLALSRLTPAAAVKAAVSVPIEARGPLALASLEVLAKIAPGTSVDRIIAIAESGDTNSRQRAIDALGKIEDPKADATVAKAIQQYIDGELPKALWLNVVEAANERLNKELLDQLAAHRETVATETPLGKWLDSTVGGDPQKGRKLFFERTELSCVRCHKVDRAGGEVGPNLTVIGKERDQRYLLEAICIPDAAIAKGFETAVIADIDGKVFSGIVKSETDDYVELILNDGTLQRVFQDDIEARRKGKSSMPADLTKQLSARELRDLVAYLFSLKVDPRAETDVE